MKRILSWIVAAVSEYVIIYILCFAISLVIRAYSSIGRLSEGLFWLAVILGGTTVLGILLGILFYGNTLIIMASEAICKSRRGIRYVVLGVLYLAVYGFITWATYIGAARGISMIACIACIISSAIFLFAGYNMTKDNMT